MKNIIILILVFTSSVCLGQIPPMGENGKFTYTEVIQVPEASKAELYLRAKEWVASHYPSASNITMDDKEAGKIVVKGNFPISLIGNKQLIDNTLTLEVKDGRYKYTFTDFTITGSSVDHWALERKDLAMKKSIYSSVDDKVKGFIESINEAMNSELKKEDW
jgi:hypothetical protein